jgi:uncharacterized membrane-anchored protein YhcB (DUF1043 family)
MIPGVNTLVTYAAGAALVVLGIYTGSLWLEKNGLERDLLTANNTISTERSQYESERASLAEALADMTGQYRAAETALTTTAIALKEAQHEAAKQTALAADAVRQRLRADATLSRLRAAPAVSGSAPAAGPEPYPPGSFGATLGEAAGPVVGIAERSELLEGLLIECRSLYERAQTSLQALTSQ